MINFFIVLWPLLLAGYVDGLEKDKKEEWHSIFHDNAAQDMANMVLCLGWDKKGYRMVIPCSGKPKLQIAMCNKSEESEWEDSPGRL